MTDTKPVVWVVSDPEDQATIVFHYHEEDARHTGAEKIECDFEYTECTRAPHFDKYRETGVPPEVLIKEHGWWFECWHCNSLVSQSAGDIVLDEIVCIDDAVYCNAACKAAKDAEIAQINNESEQFQVAILTQLPQFEITGFDGGWPCLTPCAYFTFPGAKYGGGLIRIIRHPPELIYEVTGGDLDAFYAWQASLKKEKS